MAVEAVLFDYSGVLTTSLGLPTGEVPFDRDIVAVEMIAALAGTEEHPWHKLERGEISLDDFIGFVEDLAPGAAALFALDSPLCVMSNLTLLDDRIAIAAEVKASGRQIGVVTNNVAEWSPMWRPGLPAGLFDLVIDSADVGMRKPEPQIYELALAELGGIDPANVVFIDDFEWNVAGADAVGMVGLHCEAETDLRAELAALLVAAE